MMGRHRSLILLVLVLALALALGCGSPQKSSQSLGVDDRIGKLENSQLELKKQITSIQTSDQERTDGMNAALKVMAQKVDKVESNIDHALDPVREKLEELRAQLASRSSDRFVFLAVMLSIGMSVVFLSDYFKGTWKDFALCALGLSVIGAGVLGCFFWLR